MNDKDRVFERLTGEEAPKEVLAVRRNSQQQMWFHLILDGKTIQIDDKDVAWEVDQKAKKVIATIEEEKLTGAIVLSLHITIKGPRKKINNLIFNLGMSLVDERRVPVYKIEE